MCPVDETAIRVWIRDTEMEGTVLVSSRKLFVVPSIQTLDEVYRIEKSRHVFMSGGIDARGNLIQREYLEW